MQCKAEDDNGKICGRPMSQHEFKQDGMCSRCACLIWENTVVPMANGAQGKPVIFEEN